MKKSLLIILTLYSVFVQSQEHAWVYFVDKPNEASYMASPLTMLSQRALDRRTRQNIDLDFIDIPISNTYINQIDAITGIEVKAKSKWLNAVHVLGSIAAIQNLESLTIVDYVEFASSTKNKNNVVRNTPNKFEEIQVDYNYGNATNQVEQLNLEFLHQNDFTGLGMQIAILDAGFPNVDTFAAFQNLRDNGQILGGYNYVARNDNFYTSNSHGTSVLSTIGAFIDNQIVGTAPDASFYLFITEDISSETPLEESLWVEAAEKVDSLGVDIINTSLGYQAFDESKYDYQYSDLNGSTAFISRGASILASRGIILVTSAGNSGNSFHYIGAPADATDVLTVGAVDSSGNMASFSSYGPSFDGRIKPDADAKGSSATVINSAGNVATSNGTSFASPILCGAVASFWQAFPDKTSFEIMQLVRESAHLYSNPTDHFGYGIPNFENAYNSAALIDSFTIEQISVYPNPLTDEIRIAAPLVLENLEINIFNVVGARVLTKKLAQEDNNRIEFVNFTAGIYFLKITDASNNTKIIKFIKK